MARKPAGRRKPHKRKHPRDPELSRKALLDAAAKLFNTVGYQGTDSNRIAREAGYAPGTFYTHFTDKLEIFLEVYEDWVNEQRSTIQRILDESSAGTSVRKRLTKAMLEHHRQWRTFRANLRALCATNERARKARLMQRERQISFAEHQVQSLGRPAPGRAYIWYTMLAFEVVCDSIADGDSAALSVPEASLVRMLETILDPLVP